MLAPLAAHWKGDLKQTADNPAFLGRAQWMDDVYIIDGDGGLGFNHAMIGALIIRNMIDGASGARHSLASDFYTVPKRRRPSSSVAERLTGAAATAISIKLNVAGQLFARNRPSFRLLIRPAPKTVTCVAAVSCNRG
jgi:hypothetical protein